jgi:hypothetical protein
MNHMTNSALTSARDDAAHQAVITAQNAALATLRAYRF